MFRRRFSAEAPPGLSLRASLPRFPRLGFRRAPGSEAPPVRPLAALFCGRRFFHGGRRRGTHNANIRRVEQRRRPLRLRGTPSAAYPAAPFRNNPVALLPFRLPLCLPRGGIVPGFPVRAGRVQKYTAFSLKKP